jgi:hypothetical protein
MDSFIDAKVAYTVLYCATHVEPEVLLATRVPLHFSNLTMCASNTYTLKRGEEV